MNRALLYTTALPHQFFASSLVHSPKPISVMTSAPSNLGMSPEEQRVPSTYPREAPPPLPYQPLLKARRGGWGSGHSNAFLPSHGNIQEMFIPLPAPRVTTESFQNPLRAMTHYNPTWSRASSDKERNGAEERSWRRGEKGREAGRRGRVKQGQGRESKPERAGAETLPAGWRLIGSGNSLLCLARLLQILLQLP